MKVTSQILLGPPLFGRIIHQDKQSSLFFFVILGKIHGLHLSNLSNIAKKLFFGVLLPMISINSSQYLLNDYNGNSKGPKNHIHIYFVKFESLTLNNELFEKSFLSFLEKRPVFWEFYHLKRLKTHISI